MKPSRRRLFAGTTAVLGAAGGLAIWQSGKARYYNGPVSDHFDGTRFFDQHGSYPKSFADLLRWWSSRSLSGWPKRLDIQADRPPPRVSGTNLRVSFVGHATLLIQADGLNILTDPVWSNRVSPFSFAGPKRVHEPGIAFDALPPIDAVLVSHNHWDHLDCLTLSRLAAVHRPRVIAPLGNDTVMHAHDPAIRCETFDWGARIELAPGVAVTLAPMRHWSARGLTDRNKALWAAFVIETPAGRIYHVGDSGYGDGNHFRTARELYGPFRLAVLPIGAYEPRWFMRDMHMNPEEAVQALADCGAEVGLAHHFGTFQLTDEAFNAPKLGLAAARDNAGIAATRFRTLAPGEAWEF